MQLSLVRSFGNNLTQFKSKSCNYVDRMVQECYEAGTSKWAFPTKLDISMPPDQLPPQSRSLRVLEMCTEFGVGGIARHVLDLQSWLETRGHRVALAGTASDWAGPETQSEFLSLPTRYVSEDGGHVASRISNAARAAFILRRWLTANPVDLIHAHESAPALVAGLALIGRNVPLVVTYHGSEQGRVRQFGTIVRTADLVITPSHSAAAELERIGRVQKEKIQVLGLGIKPAPEANPREVSALRKELLADGRHLIVTVARVTHQKGIEVLIDCVYRLKKSHPQFRFVLVGGGPAETEMYQLAERRGVLSHLHFAGPSETPHLYLRAADLMLLTSRWEALPITIPEAFQTATPVVATACSGVVELVDEQVGACVPIGDIDAICDTVIAVLGNAAGLHGMSNAALLRSQEDRFDPDKVNVRFEKTYRNIVARKKKA